MEGLSTIQKFEIRLFLKSPKKNQFRAKVSGVYGYLGLSQFSSNIKGEDKKTERLKNTLVRAVYLLLSIIVF